MDIRPQDLPELRAELADALAGPCAFPFHEARAARLSHHSGRQIDPAEMQTMDVEALRLGELFYIAPEMIDLAKAAARSLPAYTLELEDLPAQYGFLYFGRGAFRSNTAFAALEWAEYGSGVRMYFYADTELSLMRLMQIGQADESQAEFHRTIFGKLSPMGTEGITNFGHDPVEAKASDEEIVRTIRAVWLLMQQPLAELSEVEPDRATRKRLHRAGRKPAAVRVVELRRPKSSGTGDGGSDYHHQWIVRGHWRQQWYPAREVHRPVWIAPHIKGPEGAPLIGGEKVYALKR